MLTRNFLPANIPPIPSICLFGKTRSGKTVFWNYLIQYYRKNYKVVIFDTKNEFSTIPTLAPSDYGYRAFVRRVRSIKCNEEWGQDLRFVLELVAGGNLLFDRTILVIEESPVIIRDKIQLNAEFPNVYKLLTQGHARRQYLIVVAQNPSEMHKDFMYQSDAMFIFYINEAQRESLRPKAGRLLDFSNLPQYSFYSVSDECYFKPIKGKFAAPISGEKYAARSGTFENPEVMQKPDEEEGGDTQ